MTSSRSLILNQLLRRSVPPRVARDEPAVTLSPRVDLRQETQVIPKIDLEQKLALFREHWKPKIVGEVNDAHVKLVKLKGEFVWHHHEKEDELFLVLKGRLTMRFRDGDVGVGEGEMIIVPRGVEHMPVAEEECHVLLFEPKTTLNTGNVVNERTVADLDRI